MVSTFNLSRISLKLTRETAHVLEDHYPEHLGLAILYKPPKFFEPFWLAAKAFLETKTYNNKVKFVYSDEANTMKIMEDVFDMDQLESSFGGKDTSGFDIGKYAGRMKEDDKKIPFLWTKSNPQSLAPEQSLESASALENLDLSSDSDISDEEKTTKALSGEADSDHDSQNDNLVETNGSSVVVGKTNVEASTEISRA